MADSTHILKRGVTEPLILQLLREREMHGHELAQAIRTRGLHAMPQGEGLIYPLLHAMERARALSSRRMTVNGRSRVYYAITTGGAPQRADQGRRRMVRPLARLFLSHPAFIGEQHV